MAELAIQVDKLSKRYGKREVLRELNLHVPAGAVVGLVGVNGSGKSTLLKSLVGLIPTDSGSARILGCDSAELSPEVKERLGYVPQVVQLYPWMRVKDILAYAGSFFTHWDPSFVAELVRRWHLPLDDRASGLSGGQQQSLAMTLALGHRPDLLILDEPVAALDPLARREVLRALLDLVQDGDRTILFSTHLMSDLERVATHVAILAEGRIVRFAELDELKDSIKRIRVSREQVFPENLTIPGALRTTVKGNRALAAVAEVTPGLLARLSEDWHAQVQVEDLNLEEIFMELCGHE